MQNRLYNLVLASLLACVVTGCQTNSNRNEKSPFYTIPTGSRLILENSITFESNKLGVYFQNGQIRPFTELDQYEPHCKLELYSLSTEARTLKPDTFVVTRSVFDEIISGVHTLQYASLMQVMNSASFVEFTTYLYLTSDTQPDIHRLVCLYWGDPTIGRHLTLAEIRDSLGTHITIDLKNAQDN